ncbi:hypothetical protein IP91_03395 [Pseudoduganella lurida]|uniref:Ferritin-like domain-containing protein n=1 Tax=Pseudoduganella lurida TaxID=1036180 RepID=A0A562R2W6_9BURK|nr:hypothetical protein [Pseudoduganella lurida]TWI63425.1 hypothetical protein IP91_03395 [Pseudoduganella lurida]
MHPHADEAPLPAGLAEPALRGWPAVQAHWVGTIKRAALRQLHASVAGERLLLRIYLIGEESSEIALQSDLLGQPPAWLARQMGRHLADERLHAALFAAEIEARGGIAQLPLSARPDALTLRKISQWRTLAQRCATSFSAGHLIPAFAIGLCAEQTFARVLRRHCALLGEAHPLFSLLARVLRDEDRHVRLCQHTLAQLVTPSEHGRLAALLDEIRAIDRAWGVTGALIMYLAGAALRVWPARA